VCCALAALLVGCGGGDAATDTSTIAEQPALTPAQQRRADERLRIEQRREVEKTLAPNPYRRPSGPPPHPNQPVRHLVIRDVKVGRGPTLQGGESVYADFIRAFWRSGRVFYSAWGPMRAEYIDLEHEAEGVRRGMRGMRPGGRRIIVIPRAIADVHEPVNELHWEDAYFDIVLRTIVPN
jgi:FKBP-type peptidyl-prolyl cis-trans isomerase